MRAPRTPCGRTALSRRTSKAVAAATANMGRPDSRAPRRASTEGESDGRLNDLVVVRESDAYRGVLFKSAFARAIDGLPDADAVLAAGSGSQPGDALPPGCEVLAHNGATAALFRPARTLVVTSTWSAGMPPAETQRDHAAFADILVALIEAAKPKTVRLPDMRLVARREGHARVADAVLRNADTLVCGETVVIDMSTAGGRMLLAAISVLVDTERDAIARRMELAGLHARGGEPGTAPTTQPGRAGRGERRAPRGQAAQ